MATTPPTFGSPPAFSPSEPELNQLIREHQQHNKAFFSGSSEGEHWLHDEDITLHGGFEVSARGWSVLERGLSVAASRLSEGDMTFTPIGGRILGDVAYLAGFEEGTVRVDGGERRPMKLRVTNIFQRIDGQWLCIHRHGEMVKRALPEATS